MKPLSNSDFATKVLATANISKIFAPQGYYDPYTDCFEFIAKPDDFYAERIDKLVTVYYSRKNNELIGSLFKGIRALLKENPILMTLLQVNGRVKLAHVFIARVTMEPKNLEKGVIMVYNRLIKQAEANEVEVEVEACFA
jgi:hypothetical protein